MALDECLKRYKERTCSADGAVVKANGNLLLK